MHQEVRFTNLNGKMIANIVNRPDKGVPSTRRSTTKIPTKRVRPKSAKNGNSTMVVFAGYPEIKRNDYRGATSFGKYPEKYFVIQQ